MKYKVQQLSQPSQILSDQELKDHLRTDEASEDDLLEAMALAAHERAEHYTGLMFGERSCLISLDIFVEELSFFDYGIFDVNSITSVSYINESGSTVSFSGYELVDSFSFGSKIIFDSPLPTVQEGRKKVLITFSAGLPVVPESVKAAMKLIVGNLYEHREDDSLMRVSPISVSSKALLDQVKQQAGAL